MIQDSHQLIPALSSKGSVRFIMNVKRLIALSAVVALLSLTSCRSGSEPTEISRDWTVAINQQFNGAGNFTEGLAAVRVGGEDDGKWGYIDKQGKFLINPQFDGAGEFNDGLAAVSRVGDGGKWGFIDKHGKLVISPQFESVWPWRFENGLAAVQVGDDKTGKWGFIDAQGKFVVSPQFDYSYAFSEGLAKVGLGRNQTRWGFIDKDRGTGSGSRWGLYYRQVWLYRQAGQGRHQPAV